MPKPVKAQYTPEFKVDAVRLAESMKSIAGAARQLGVVEQTMSNWVRLHRKGKKLGAVGRPPSGKPPQTVAQRVAALRERNRSLGLVDISFEIDQEHSLALSELCRQGGLTRSRELQHLIHDAYEEMFGFWPPSDE